MAKQVLNNHETGLEIRNKINDNFTEVYDEVSSDITAISVIFTPDADIEAINVQQAIVEVRDESDTKNETQTINGGYF